MFHATVTGNLLENPKKRFVNVGDKPVTVVELRIMSDMYRKDASGSYVQNDKSTFPVSVSIWNEKVGETVEEVLVTGARVQVTGTLTQANAYIGKDGKPYSDIHVNADTVALLISPRIKAITFAPKNNGEGD